MLNYFNPITASVHFMHIPDGFLTLSVSLICWALTAVTLAVAVRKAQATLDERLIPLAGIMAAFIFAGQMINFPVAGGTSGHLVGATLAAVVLGPWLGILVMTAVISLQALLFQDGGLVVMGANILVMGVVPVLVGYGIYRAVANRGRRLKLVSVAVAAWLSIEAAAFVVSLFLGFSGTSSLRFVIPAMMGVHALIGIGEALITVAALGFIIRARPQLLQGSAKAGGRAWIAAGLAVALLVALLAPLASSSPDGLARVAEDFGFLDEALSAPFQLLPNYTIPGLGQGKISTILAGVGGTIAVALFAFGLVRLLQHGRKRNEPTAGGGDQATRTQEHASV